MYGDSLKSTQRTRLEFFLAVDILLLPDVAGFTTSSVVMLAIFALYSFVVRACGCCHESSDQ